MSYKKEKGPKNWFEFLHGKGHEFYDSKAAKEIYGKQLVSLSEKVLWAMFAPYIGYFLAPEKVEFFGVVISSISFFVLGLFFRHQGLKIIDGIETQEIKIYVPPEKH